MNENMKIIKAVLYYFTTQSLWPKDWFWPTNCVMGSRCNTALKSRH